MIRKTDLFMVRGDDFVRRLTFRRKADKTLVNVSSWSFAGQVRTDPDSATVLATFAFDTSDAVNGVVTISLAAEETADFNDRYLYYDIEATEAGLKTTRLIGRIDVTRDTTHA